MPHLKLSDAAYKQIADFANRTGTTASAAANEAIYDWMDIHGEPILKAMERLRKKKERTCRVLVFRAVRKT